MRNPYKALRALIPDPPLLAGAVINYADGIATVELPGGGTVAARGEAQAGDQVFVRDGVIEGPAPLLTAVLIDV